MATCCKLLEKTLGCQSLIGTVSPVRMMVLSRTTLRTVSIPYRYGITEEKKNEKDHRYQECVCQSLIGTVSLC